MTDRRAELQMETHPNSHVVSWSTRMRLTDSMIVDFESKDWKMDDIDSPGGLEDEKVEKKRLAPFVDALFGIPGVESVTIEQYEFSIQKGKSFTWEEITPRVKEIFKTHISIFG